MAISLSDAVQTAVYTRLVAGVTLASVHSVIPENTQPPVVTIADAAVTVETTDFERHALRIVSIVAGSSKRPLFALMQQIKDALDGKPLTSAGATLSAPVLLGSDDRLSDDGLALIGEQTFLIFAQPSD